MSEVEDFLNDTDTTDACDVGRNGRKMEDDDASWTEEDRMSESEEEEEDDGSWLVADSDDSANAIWLAADNEEMDCLEEEVQQLKKEVAEMEALLISMDKDIAALLRVVGSGIKQ
jgi:hypothetical protein